jgi:hypothetical protein
MLWTRACTSDQSLAAASEIADAPAQEIAPKGPSYIEERAVSIGMHQATWLSTAACDRVLHAVVHVRRKWTLQHRRLRVPAAA